jgi:hypothetical protein
MTTGTQQPEMFKAMQYAPLGLLLLWNKFLSSRFPTSAIEASALKK